MSVTATTADHPLETWPSTRIYLALAVGAVVISLVSTARYGGDRLAWLFGPVPDPIGVALVTAIGWFAVRFVDGRGWFGHRPGYTVAVVAATALAVVAAAVDLTIPFPEDMNRAWPESLLYYPSVALVAEVVLHLAPLAALLALTGWRFEPNEGLDGRALIAIGAVALTETFFQVVASAAGDDDPRLLPFVAIHLTVIGVIELALLRRSGLGPMLTLRLTYYLWWHIVWGNARLSILF